MVEQILGTAVRGHPAPAHHRPVLRADKALRGRVVEKRHQVVEVAAIPVRRVESSVPSPPGSAIKASESSARRALRWCMVSTTSSRVSPSCPTSLAASPRGMTPITRPPPASAASAATPIKPTRPPPKTRVRPRAAIAWPSASASERYSGRRPGLEPQKTQTAERAERGAGVSSMGTDLTRCRSVQGDRRMKPPANPGGQDGRDRARRRRSSR